MFNYIRELLQIRLFKTGGWLDEVCLGLKKVDTFRKGKTCPRWMKTILLARATGSFVQNENYHSFAR